MMEMSEGLRVPTWRGSLRQERSLPCHCLQAVDTGGEMSEGDGGSVQFSSEFFFSD